MCSRVPLPLPNRIPLLHSVPRHSLLLAYVETEAGDAMGMSTQRVMPGGRALRHTLPKSASGRTLCRWCSLEVPAGRFTFCSAWCVHEWRMRTSPGYVREQLLRRDRGICALCRTDTLSAWRRLKKARGDARSMQLASWGLKRLNRRTLWDADHVLPVAEGGGECDLDNFRTLCIRCHRAATGALRLRLRAQKLAVRSATCSREAPESSRPQRTTRSPE